MRKGEHPSANSSALLRALLIAEQEFLAKPSNVRSFHGSDSFRKQLEFIAPRLRGRPVRD